VHTAWTARIWYGGAGRIAHREKLDGHQVHQHGHSKHAPGERAVRTQLLQQLAAAAAAAAATNAAAKQNNSKGDMSTTK
jgi:hypothetical protein